MTRRLIEILTFGLLTTAAIGCAGNLPETQHGRAAGEWQVRLPSTPSTFGKLALGTGGSAQPATISEPDSQSLLAAKKPTPRKHTTSRVAQPGAPSTPPVVVAAAEPQAPVAIAKPAAAPTLVASNEATPEQRYAQRETQSQKLQGFRGGDAIIISGGVLLVVLLIVLLVLLLR